VLKYLEREKYLQALQLNDFLIVHVDTDIAHLFGISRGPLTAEEHILAIVTRLLETAGPKLPRERVIFAIAVDEMECWLLPCVFDRSEKKKLQKVTGCLAAVDKKLRQKDMQGLWNGVEKKPEAYRDASRPLTARAFLLKTATNVGLQWFLIALGHLS
jgi:hypothetical protein